MPPSAMTVCAFPKSDLQTRPTDTPAADASIAARSPAPPAPITMTSCSWTWYSIKDDPFGADFGSSPGQDNLALLRPGITGADDNSRALAKRIRPQNRLDGSE